MLKNYIKIALKVLLRRTFFTFVSFFGISFTLAVLIVATAMLDQVFAPSYPESRLDRIVGIQRARLTGPQGARTASPGYRFLDHYVRTLEGPEHFSIFKFQERVSAYQNGHKLTLWLKRTDGEFWKIFDFDFVAGSPFTTLDDSKANFVAVINESAQARVFGTQSAVGQMLEIDGQRFRVVGVVRDVPFTRLRPFADVWVPISTMKSTGYRDELVSTFMGVVLAKRASDIPSLRARFDNLIPTVSLPDPKRFDTFHSALETPFETTALGLGLPSALALRAILVVFAFLFMTLPAINLVNLNLSRMLERSSEIGVRRAFGATRLTLVAQFVIENVILTLLGGALALVISAVTLGAINNSGLIPYAQFAVNFRVFFWGLFSAVVFGLFSGVYPAWRMSRLDPVTALRGIA